MAAQLEDGYTRIANEILDHLMKQRLNGTQNSIIQCVIRYTYGFQRKSHELSINFIKDATGINKDMVKRELNNLIDYKVLTVFKEATFRTSREIGINKSTEDWNIPSGVKSPEVTKTPPVVESVEIQGTKTPPGGGDVLHPQERKRSLNIFKNNTTTTDDEFYAPITPESTEVELQRAVQSYVELHGRQLAPKDWPEITKMVKEYGADHVINVMENKLSAASGEVNSFRYYLSAIKDKSRGNYRNQPSRLDLFNDL